MKAKKLCLSLLATAVMLSAVGATVVATPSAEESSANVSVTRNFDLLNSDFSDYQLYTHEMNTLTDAYNPRPCDVMAQNGFSGLLSQVTDDTKYSWMSNFALFTGSESGAWVDIGSYYSAFTTIARPIQSGGVNIPFGTGDFDELEYVFTDLENPDNSLKVTFRDDRGNISYAYVSYNGSPEKKVGMGAFCFRGGHWFSVQNPPDGVKVPLVFRFDAKKKELVTDFRLNIKVNLGDYFKDFSGFEHFSVKMAFPSVAKGKTANLIVYEINSQLLVGQEFPHNVAPQLLLQDVYPKGIKGQVYILPEARAIHMSEGDLTEEMSTEVLDPEGIPVTPKDGRFVAAKSGDYTVTYVVQDSYGLEATERRVITIYDVLPMSEIIVSEGIGARFGIGHTLRIPSATVNGSAADIVVTVQRGGKVLECFRDVGETNLFKLTDIGDYNVIYTYKNELGNIDSVSYRVECADIPALIYPNLPEKISFGSGASVYVGETEAVFGEEKKIAELAITSPDGTSVSLNEDSMFIPTVVGTYKFVYTAVFGEQTLSQTYYINAVYSADGLFENVSDVDEFVNDMPIKYLVEEGVNGLGVIGKTNNMTVRFKNAIDLNHIDPKKDFIRLQPLSGDGYAPFASIIITLTDAHDASRSVKVRFQDNGQYAYAMVNFDGRFLGRSNEASSDGLIRVNEYGTVMGSTFQPDNYSGKFQFAFQINYEEKQFTIWQQDIRGGELVNIKQELILDADDISHVGDGNSWGGFTTGEVFVSISVPYMYGKGGFIISEIGGKTIGGKTLTDNSEPDISLKLSPEYEVMPKGIAGMKYFVPEPFANDFYAGNRAVTVSVLKEDGGVWNEIIADLKESEFIPESAGNYRIVYSTSDYAGNAATLTKDVTVETSLPALNAEYVSQPERAVVGNSYLLPEIAVSGGSGILKSETEVFYNNQKVNVGSSGRIYLNDIGKIRIEVTISDYLKQQAKKTFEINVRASREPIISVEGVPDSVRLDGTLTLPDFTAYDFNYGSDEDGFYADRKILVNGTEIDLETRTFKVTSTDPIKVVYQAESDGMIAKKEFTINVVAGNYIFGDKEITIEKEQSFTTIGFSENTVLSFANPVTADDLLIKFGIVAEKNKFGYIDIVFEDYYNSKISLFVRLTPKDDKSSYLEVNANTGKRISVPGSFSSEDAMFGLILDNSGCFIANEEGAKIANFDRTSSGDDFYGFPSGGVRVRISFGNVTAESEIRLYRLSNQSFATFNGQYSDAAPVPTYYGDLINTSIQKGEEFTVPAAAGFDVFNGVANVTVTVTGPNGTILDKVPANKDYTVTGSEYGDYSINYIISDGARTARTFFTIHVTDNEPPVITVNGNIAGEASLGVEFAIPGATVTDNMTENLTVYIFVLTPGGKYISVKENTYEFTEKGAHKVIYYAVDEDYNTASRVFDVNVK